MPGLARRSDARAGLGGTVRGVRRPDLAGAGCGAQRAVLSVSVTRCADRDRIASYRRRVVRGHRGYGAGFGRMVEAVGRFDVPSLRIGVGARLGSCALVPAIGCCCPAGFRRGSSVRRAYGVGSANWPPRMSLFPKVAGQLASTSGAACGVAVYSEAR